MDNLVTIALPLLQELVDAVRYGIHPKATFEEVTNLLNRVGQGIKVVEAAAKVVEEIVVKDTTTKTYPPLTVVPSPTANPTSTAVDVIDPVDPQVP